MSEAREDKGSVRHKLDILLGEESSSLTWDSVFAAASSARLEEVGDDFLERTRSKDVHEGLAAIARLGKKEDRPARNEPAKKKPKLVPAPDLLLSNKDPELEGRMVAHPEKADEKIMVLIEKGRKVVYSAMKRTEDGDMVQVGQLDEVGRIVWFKGALEWDNEEDSEHGGSDSFPFPTDPDDHCESPLEAYQDILPLLEQLFPIKTQCRVYDPYYCNGAVKRNLASLGFHEVHNEKEDCYTVWSSKKCPHFDVLITNPPYSQDHIPKLVDFLSSSVMNTKPWFLLMPQWVSKKSYFVEKWDKKAFFLVPKKRYVYLPPKDFRERKASDVHKKSSPFVSIWFVWGGTIEQTNKMYVSYRNKCGLHSGTCEIARSKNALRDLRRKTRKISK